MGERVLDGYVVKRLTKELEPLEFGLPEDIENLMDVNVIDVKYAIKGEKLIVWGTVELLERVNPDKNFLRE